MHLNYTLKTAVIIALFLSCFTAYSQSSTPFISQLEGMNEGKEVKITMIDGIIGKDYTIQYRLKNTVDWLDSPVKIKRSNELSEEVLTGLESNKNYCFRLMKRDSLSKSEIISTEVCSINLKSTIISDDEVKLEWNKIDTIGLRRIFVVQMDDDGKVINRNFTKFLSDTVFVFGLLDCSKNYKFNITTDPLINSKAKTVIKSPKVSVNLSLLIAAFPLESVGVVSLSSSNVVNYNIFYTTNTYIKKYEIYRSTNGGEMIRIGESTSNSYNDSDVDINKNYYCYANRYVNDCDKKSDLSGKSCTVKLSSETPNRLTWTPFIIQAGSNFYRREKTEYIVQLTDKNQIIIATDAATTDTTITIDIENFPKYQPSYQFRVLAVMTGQLNFNSQIQKFPLYSYSNQASLYLILSNESPKTQMNIFPNPTEDRILINSSGIPVRFIELIDMKGQLIYKTEISGDTVNLSEFEKGKYILRLYDANKKLLNTRNIVKW